MAKDQQSRYPLPSTKILFTVKTKELSLLEQDVNETEDVIERDCNSQQEIKRLELLPSTACDTIKDILVRDSNSYLGV